MVDPLAPTPAYAVAAKADACLKAAVPACPSVAAPVVGTEEIRRQPRKALARSVAGRAGVGLALRSVP